MLVSRTNKDHVSFIIVVSGNCCSSTPASVPSSPVSVTQYTNVPSDKSTTAQEQSPPPLQQRHLQVSDTFSSLTQYVKLHIIDIQWKISRSMDNHEYIRNNK